MKRKVLSVLLTLALCLQLIPMSAFATEVTPVNGEATEEQAGVMTASASNAVAKIGSQEYVTLAEAFENADAGDRIILLDDISMSDWTSVDIKKKLVLDGDGNTITNLKTPLVKNSSADFTIEDLTVSDADIEIKSASGGDNDTSAAALVQWANGGTLTIDSVFVIDSTIKGDGYVAAMVGFVDSTANGVVVKGGTIEDNSLTAGGTVGSVAGHTYADVTVEGITISGNSLTSNSDDGTRPDKVGLVVGRLNADTVTISATVSKDNTVAPAGTNTGRIIGSIPGGTAIVACGEYPSDPTVTGKDGQTVSVAEGVTAAENEDGSWSVHAWEAATCKAPKTCTVCEKTKGDALEHSWDAGVVDKPATEDEKGNITYTCGLCDETKTEEIPALGHTHKWTTVTVDPTCTTAGYTVEVCDCKEEQNRKETPATDHSWDAGVVDKPATENEAGNKTYTCELCDETKTEVIPALGHTHDWETVTVNATCTTDGYTVELCSCKAEQNRVEIAAGHKITTAVTVPTCTTKGYTTDSCSVCGYSNNYNFKAALDHKWESKEVVEATGNTEGKETFECSECDAIKTEVIPKTGCTFTEKVTAPTCTEQGYTTYTCTTCTGDAQNHSYIGNYKAAKGHKLTTVVTAPTCTAKGYTTHTCNVSGCSYTVKSAFTEMIAHTYVFFSSKAATSEAEGENVYKCSCDAKRIEVIPAIGHSFTSEVTEEATCVEDGENTFTCMTCAEEGKSHTYTEVILATGHDWGVSEVTPADCRTSGYTTQTCTACDAKKVTDKIDMEPHNFVDGICTVCQTKNASASENKESEVTVLDSLSADHDKLDYTTVDEIKDAMAEAGNVSDDMTSTLYDITLTADGEACAANNFPAEGYVFQIGVPDDAADGTEFVVSHMITETYGGNLAGDIEILESWLDETEENICFRTYSTSPVLLSYTKTVVDTDSSYDDVDNSEDEVHVTKKPEAVVKTGTWKLDAIGWWYENADGSYPTSCWMELEYEGKTEWYHFDSVGYMQIGWFTDTDGNIYYLNPAADGTQGRMLTDWQLIAGQWYYFNTVSDGTKGAMFVNRTTPDGYQVDANGVWIQ